jgi:hypothetical protein
MTQVPLLMLNAPAEAVGVPVMVSPAGRTSVNEIFVAAL